MKQCFHNALWVDGSEGLSPRRFTKEQTEFYENLSYGGAMGMKTRMTAGITLEFATDANELELRWSVLEGYPFDNPERLSSIDISVNGLLREQIEINGSWHEERRSRLCFEPGRKLITIWLPHTHVFSLHDIEIPAGTSFDPVPKREGTVLLLGDSITQGIGTLCASDGYAMLLSSVLSGYEVINQGIAAVCFEADGLAPLWKTPDLILLALGTNDWTHRMSAGEYKIAVCAYLEKLTAIFPRVPVLMISPLKRCRGETEKTGMYKENELYRQMKSFAAPYPQIRLLDGWQRIPHLQRYFLDGLHPNLCGMQQFVLRLLPEVNQLLRQS